MLARLLAACLLFSIFSSTPVSAQVPKCTPLSRFIEIAKTAPKGMTYKVLEHEELEKANAFINSIPPETEHNFSVVVVLFWPGGDKGFLLVGEKNAVCGLVDINDYAQWFRFQRAVLGISL
jgi:hypothetical protein